MHQTMCHYFPLSLFQVHLIFCSFLYYAPSSNAIKHREKCTELKESMLLADYQDYVLDVTDINSNAIRCYTNIGFKEFKRIPEKHGKQKGFNEKIYMRYVNSADVSSHER